MGKASGVSRRRKKRYNYKRNVKRLHQKLITMPKVKCKQLQEAWDTKKSYYKNMEEFGLSEDPNKTIGKKGKRKATKMEIVNDLEAEANAPQPKTLRLPTEPMKFCVYMIEKYGDDYEAMARDTKNYYQATPAQIKKKIKKFKSVPCQWNGYLRAKGLIESDSKQNEYQIDIDNIMNETTVVNTPMDQE